MNLLSLTFSVLSICTPNSPRVSSREMIVHVRQQQPAAIASTLKREHPRCSLVGGSQFYEARVRDDQQSSNWQRISTDLNCLALVYVTQGRFDDAIQEFQRVLQPNALGVPPSPVESATAYQMLGEIWQVKGNFPEAEAAYERGIAVAQRAFGVQDIDTATVMNSLGWLYSIWGRPADAFKTLDRAWTIADRVLPANSPDRLVFLDSQAASFSSNNRYTEAEKCWLEALRIARTAYGDDSHRYLSILIHLGEMYSSLGDYESAERYLRQSLDTSAKPGIEPVVTRAVVVSELGSVYTRWKKYDQAKTLVSNSTRLVENNSSAPLGNALIFGYAGDYYMSQHDWPNAASSYQRALAFREKTLGDHPLVASSLLSLSQALRKLHRKKEAKQCFARASQILAIRTARLTASDTIDVRAFRQKQ